MAASEDIDLELIAAFIDGRLSGAEREQVVRLLAESEAAFEVYADAVRIRADLEGETPATDRHTESLDEHRRRRTSHWWVSALPLAAAAALLIAILPRMQARGSQAGLDFSAESIVVPLLSPASDRLTATPTAGQASARTELAVALGPAWDEQNRTVFRGGGGALVDTAVALRLGVRATDLQLALTLGERDRASRILADMSDLLKSVRLSETAQADYDRLRARITAGDSVNQIADAASQADQGLGALLGSQWFGYGKWFAASELAARARSKSFFASSQTKAFLQSTIASGSLAPEDVALLRQVIGLGPDLSDAEFDQIRGVFAELIRRHGG